MSNIYHMGLPAQAKTLAGQARIVVYFAIKWLPREPSRAALLLGWQALAGIAALSPVFLLGW